MSKLGICMCVIGPPPGGRCEACGAVGAPLPIVPLYPPPPNTPSPYPRPVKKSPYHINIITSNNTKGDKI